MIKVLHFELSDNAGGIESFLLNLYRTIDREEFHFDFVTRFDMPGCCEEFRKLGAGIYRVPGLSRPASYFSGINRILDRGYDIVHIHKNSAANPLPFLAASGRNDVHVIAHSHNTAPSVGRAISPAHILNRNTVIRRSEVLLACSDPAGRWMYGNREFTTVFNGIETERYRFSGLHRAEIRKEFSIAENTTVIGNVGRLEAQKNQTRLLKIFSEFHKLQPDSKLLLAGDGSLLEKLKAQSVALGIGDSVIFTGSRSDIEKLLSAMDIFVMTSLYEGLPVAAIEAQASGLQVLFPDTVTLETAVTDRAQNFVLSDDDRSLAVRILDISQKGGAPDDRLKYCDAVSSAGYDIRSTADKIAKIYRGLCSNR